MNIGMFLQAIFRILELQAPKSFHRILGLLIDIRLKISVGEDSQNLRFGRTGLALVQKTDITNAFVETSKPCIRNLVDGKMAFVDAIKNEDLYIRGPKADLSRLDQAFVLLLQSSLRSSEIQDLYSDYTAKD